MATQVNPFDQFDEQPVASQGGYPGVIQGQPSQSKMRDEARKDEDQAMQRESLRLQQEAAARSAEEAANKKKERALGVDATEGERNNKAFYERALRAIQVYDEKGLGPRSFAGQAIAGVWGGEDLLRGLPDAVGDSPDRQITEQAKKDFVTMILRSDSGANAPEPEVMRAISTYFPRAGETDPDVLANYANARLEALRGLKAKAGRLSAELPDYIPATPPVSNSRAGDANPADAAYIKDGAAYDKAGNYLGLAINMEDGPLDPGSPPGGGGSNIPISQDMIDRATKLEQASSGDPASWRGLAQLGAQGITLNSTDEAAGIGGFISNLIAGEDPRAGYITARDARQAQLDKASQAWGGAGTAMEFLGGGAGARLTALPATLVQAGKQGGLLGALSGFGSGRGAEGSTVNALTGTVVGAGLGVGFQAAGNALASRAARNAPDLAVVEAGQRQGIPIRQPDARPELRGQMAQAETSQTAGPIIRDARAADANAIEQRVAEIGGQGNPSDPYALGSRVQEAGQRYIAKTKQQATRLYDRAKQLAGNTTVTARNADAALDANIQELRAAGENSNGAAIKYLEGLRSDIDRGLSLESVQNLRTNLRGQISQQGLTGTDTERRVAQVIDAMNQDLTEQLPKEAGQALNAADAFYKQRQEFINGTLKQFMGNRGNPLPAETAAQRLVSMAQGKGNFERFSNMWKQLEPAEQADVAATIAASLGRKANGEFSIATLIRSLDPAKGINPRTARTVFGEDGAKALQDLRIIAAAKTETGQALNNSRTGVMVNQATGGLKTLLWGAVGMMGGGPGGAAAGAVSRNLFAAWGEQRAAKMLLNPDFTKWLRNAPNTANPQAIDRYFARLATIKGVSANDNQAFTNAITQAFRSSPGTVAAAGQQEDKAGSKPPQ